MIKRLYRCNECGFEFHSYQEKNEALLTDCPECVTAAVEHDLAREREEGEARIARMVESGVPPGVQGIRSQAMKHAEKAMHAMGMTDMNDTGRQGDRAAKAPSPMHSGEIDQMTRAMVEAKALNDGAQAEAFAKGARSFWSHNDPQEKAKLAEAAKRNPLAAAVARAPMVAPGAALAARQMERDPIKLLHEGEKKHGVKYDVISRVRG